MVGDNPLEKYRELGQGEKWKLEGFRGVERDLFWGCGGCLGITGMRMTCYVRLIRSWGSGYPQSIHWLVRGSGCEEGGSGSFLSLLKWRSRGVLHKKRGSVYP